MKTTKSSVKSAAMMTVLVAGLFFICTNQLLAQKNCPDNLEEEALKKCWITQAKSGNKDLRNAYLVDADLQNVDLSKADLSNAQIVSANFSGANCTGANLTNVNLTGTNFMGANFSRANLTKTKFLQNNLTNADFTGAIFSKTVFSDTKIGGAKLDLRPLQCQVTTNGENLNWEDSNGKVYGSLKNGTVVYRDFFAWDNGRISVAERRGDELVGVGLVDGKFVTCAKTTLKPKTKSKRKRN